jgi:hypothetical protein
MVYLARMRVEEDISFNICGRPRLKLDRLFAAAAVSSGLRRLIVAVSSLSLLPTPLRFPPRPHLCHGSLPTRKKANNRLY